MAVFAIADLHLSLGTDKPMNIFGPAWERHDIRIEENFQSLVSDKDTVLIPGDISWAMRPEDALEDLKYIDRLPGQKIITKGNHDFWWGTSGKVEKMMADAGITSIRLLKNNAFYCDGTIVCGTRGWILPEHAEFSLADRLILDREVGRLARSLRAGEQLRQFPEDRTIVMMHYPPLLSDRSESGFSELCVEFGVDICVYGHLHGKGHEKAIQGLVRGVDYRLTSADYIGFKPLRL
ncbi:MAG: serine/threonine protein phosphatase [Clostridiaceae bacterium]|nr:serine/threonine protein phosphatase [Clostridiaceae bacterium]